ncbi:hypothetical protein TVAG_295440 [Trichomonas vaginalis G3]|uniref:Uncharacterized protein n=1 Tax=Trichomonas vaginalis (strain ATCC PRA-98 / G3) TaxID=412133 RepID=A2DLA0_TRIV3|nr:hypothetical protein TVAGG3_0272870 [Trichomonas vaginalis G3]EAY18891.1 hypothetical protein TVAG_295440 [Trichomonas vaginalis G3]KAI5525990.1 hypothetical protein TVAGG3_0272870 [Trichomonas vaginalis G3]|eukprot:XP_001579877.1 hypothetical protein [Trichomonas vaginalis G3]
MRASLTRPILTTQKVPESARASTSQQLTPAQLSYNPSPEDLTLISTIKNQFEGIVAKSMKVIEENETIYGIQTTYQDVVKQTLNSYQIFYNAANTYFQKHQTLRLTAVTNQVISSASCRIPSQNFGKDWKTFSKQIDLLADSHPPPHISEIQIRFQSIISAIEIINTSNSRRRYPSLTLNGCVGSILNLNSSLKQKITDLFLQPIFPKFEGNVLKSYIDEMLTYKQVLTDAFSNEFVQSGIMPCDLSRIRGNIFNDVDDIVNLIKSSFVFPDEMKEIQSEKNNLDKNLISVFQKLSIPFAVVKPLNPLVPTKKPAEETEEEKDKKPVQVSEEAELLQFIINQIGDITGNAFSETKRDAVNEIISYYLNQETILAGKITETTNLKNMYDTQKHQSEEEIEMLKQKLEVLTNHYEEMKKELATTTSKFQQYEKKVTENADTMTNLQNQIENLTKLGNPLYLRKHIRRILELENDQSADDELIEKLKELIHQIKTKKCDKCEVKDAKISNIEDKLHEATGNATISPIDAIEYLKNKISSLNSEIEALKQSETELHNDLYGIAVNECQTPRINEQKINSMTVPQVYEHIMHRVKILKRNSVSAEEMAQRMFQEFYEKLNSVIKNFNEITNDEITIPPIGQTDEEKEASIAKLIDILKSLKISIDKKIELHLQKQDELNKEIQRLELELGTIGSKMLNALNIKTDLANNKELVNVAFKALSDIQSPYLEKIDSLEKRVKELSEGVSSIYSRTVSVFKADPNEKSVDIQIQTMHSIFNTLNDRFSEKRVVIENSEKRIEFLRSQISSIVIKMCNAVDGDITQDLNELNDNELIDELFRFTQIMISPTYSDSFLSSDQLMKTLSSVTKYFTEENAGNPLEFIKLIVKRFSDQEKAISLVSNLDPIVESMLRKVSELEKYEKLSDAFLDTRNRLNRFRMKVEKISQVTNLPGLLQVIRSLALLTDMIILANLSE